MEPRTYSLRVAFTTRCGTVDSAPVWNSLLTDLSADDVRTIDRAIFDILQNYAQATADRSADAHRG